MSLEDFALLHQERVGAFPTSVNDQVTDSVTQSNLKTAGDQPALEMGRLYRFESDERNGIVRPAPFAAHEPMPAALPAPHILNVFSVPSSGMLSALGTGFDPGMVAAFYDGDWTPLQVQRVECLSNTQCNVHLAQLPHAGDYVLQMTNPDQVSSPPFVFSV